MSRAPAIAENRFYDLAATDKESAELEASQYLERHPVIEVWSDDQRRVARIKKQD
jgi:hypothetical protein